MRFFAMIMSWAISKLPLTRQECLRLDDLVKPEAEWRSHDQPSFPFDFIRYDEFVAAVSGLATSGLGCLSTLWFFETGSEAREVQADRPVIAKAYLPCTPDGASFTTFTCRALRLGCPGAPTVRFQALTSTCRQKTVHSIRAPWSRSPLAGRRGVDGASVSTQIRRSYKGARSVHVLVWCGIGGPKWRGCPGREGVVTGKSPGACGRHQGFPHHNPTHLHRQSEIVPKAPNPPRGPPGTRGSQGRLIAREPGYQASLDEEERRSAF